MSIIYLLPCNFGFGMYFIFTINVTIIFMIQVHFIHLQNKLHKRYTYIHTPPLSYQ